MVRAVKSKKASRKFLPAKLSACGCISVGVGILVTFILVALLAHRHWKNSALCFHLDILRARSPHGLEEQLRVPRANEPQANGPLCIYLDQDVIQWRLDETFTYAFDGDIVDFTLHGPTKEPNDGSVAPAVAELGIRRTTRTSALRGSKLAPTTVIQSVAQRPDLYYVAFHALKMDATATVEIARDYLDKPAK